MRTKSSSRFLIPILTFGVFGIINTEMGVVSIIPLIAERYGVTVAEAGWTVSVFAVIVALSAPVLPVFFSKYGRRSVMLFSLGLFAFCGAVSAVTDSFWVLLAARAVPAFMHPVYVSAAFTVAALSGRADEAAKAVSQVFVGVSAGMVLGVPASGFVASHLSLSAAMAAMALVNGISFFLAFFFIPESPSEEKTQSALSQFAVLRRPEVVFSAMAFLFVNGAMFGFFSYMSDFLLRVTELDFDTVSWMLFGYGLANIAGNMAGGRLIGAHRDLSAAVPPALLFIIYALLWRFGGSFAASCALILFCGLTAGYVSVAGQDMISGAAPETPDFANSLFLASANFGTMAGTAFCGVWLTASGVRESLAGAEIFLLAAGVFLYLTLRVRKDAEHHI